MRVSFLILTLLFYNTNISGAGKNQLPTYKQIENTEPEKGEYTEIGHISYETEAKLLTRQLYNAESATDKENIMRNFFNKESYNSAASSARLKEKIFQFALRITANHRENYDDKTGLVSFDDHFTIISDFMEINRVKYPPEMGRLNISYFIKKAIYNTDKDPIRYLPKSLIGLDSKETKELLEDFIADQAFFAQSKLGEKIVRDYLKYPEINQSVLKNFLRYSISDEFYGHIDEDKYENLYKEIIHRLDDNKMLCHAYDNILSLNSTERNEFIMTMVTEKENHVINRLVEFGANLDEVCEDRLSFRERLKSLISLGLLSAGAFKFDVSSHQTKKDCIEDVIGLSPNNKFECNIVDVLKELSAGVRAGEKSLDREKLTDHGDIFYDIRIIGKNDCNFALHQTRFRIGRELLTEVRLKIGDKKKFLKTFLITNDVDSFLKKINKYSAK